MIYCIYRYLVLVHYSGLTMVKTVTKCIMKTVWLGNEERNDNYALVLVCIHAQ